MKRFFFALFVLLSLVLNSEFRPSPLLGTAYADSYEAVTIDTTSGGVGLTAATYGRAQSALCRLETAEIRFTHDGSTSPTALVGVPLEPLEWIVLDSPDRIRNFRGFRTTGSSGSLKCHYYTD